MYSQKKGGEQGGADGTLATTGLRVYPSLRAAAV